MQNHPLSKVKAPAKPRVLFIGPEDGGGISTINDQVRRIVSDSESFSIRKINTTPWRKKWKFLGYLCLYALTVIKIVFFRPRIVYLQISQTGYFHQSIFLLIAKLFGRRTVGHFHAKPSVSGTAMPANFRRILASQRYVDELLVLADCSKDDLIKHGWRGRITVIPNFVEVSRFPASPKPFAEREVIIFIGRMHEQKGIFGILEIAQLLPSERFLFIGPFDSAECQKRFMSVLDKVKNAEWIGPIFDARKIEFMASAKLFLFPTETEVFPMSLLEALMCGTVPFVTPVGLIPDLIQHNRTGVHIKHRDSQGTAKAIQGVLGSPGAWAELSTAGREFALQNYTDAHVRQQLNSVLHSA